MLNLLPHGTMRNKLFLSDNLASGGVNISQGKMSRVGVPPTHFPRVVVSYLKYMRILPSYFLILYKKYI